MVDIEATLKNMLTKKPLCPATAASKGDFTAVVGGLQGFTTIEEAEGWYWKSVAEWNLSAPLKVYKKDKDGFKP